MDIKRLENPDEAQWCAQVMASSEPWITLGRSAAESLTIITDPLKEVYLATLEGERVGFVIINMNGAFIGYIQTVCMASDQRGKGLGGQLINFAETRILRDSPNVFLCVSSFNQEAKKLYERLGYQVIGELTDYLVTGYGEILMRKTIGPIKDFQKRTQT
jgi:ribosomal protein S18 acetylase RimI-like enzyme